MVLLGPRADAIGLWSEHICIYDKLLNLINSNVKIANKKIIKNKKVCWNFMQMNNSWNILYLSTSINGLSQTKLFDNHFE